MYGANNYGYNPYGTYIPQRPLQQPLQQPLQNAENSAQLFNAVQRCSVLNGKQVDSIDVVKAMDIPLDGSTSYFPLVDGSAIVTKQLQNDGTSKIIVFKPTDVKEKEIGYITKEEMDKAIKGIDLSDIDDLKEELKELRQDIKDIKKNKKRDD